MVSGSGGADGASGKECKFLGSTDLVCLAHCYISVPRTVPVG